MNRHLSLIAAPLLVTLAACSSDSDYDFDASRDTLTLEIAARSAPQALFNPATLVVPFPNNLSFLGSTDGTLNLPVADTDDQSLANPRVALNQSDGFSTVAPISTAISEPLDPDTLILGETVLVYEVNTMQGIAVTGVIAEIEDPLLIAVRSIGSNLVLIPTVPLKPKTDYLVILTNGITDVDGEPLTASLLYDILKGDQPLTDPGLELLRNATATHVDFSGVDVPDNIALSWVFKTQSIRDVLQATKNQSTASRLVLSKFGQNTGVFDGGQGLADIYSGELDIPYYLSALGEDGNSDTVLNSYWHNSGGNVVGTVNEGDTTADYAPEATSLETIPVLMSVPNIGEMPVEGWPVTIFQHGITGNRTNMLAVADAMAKEGRVVIGIDMPMHGLIDSNDLLFTELERTFGIDRVVNPLEEDEIAELDAPTSGSDGKPDPSGMYYINLQNLANSRDNLRQSIADLFVLSASLGGAEVEGLSLNPNNLSFVGHSLGGIVGTTMLSYDYSFHSASLAMPGGGIAQLLANSPDFSPEINEGLAANGILKGSTEYNLFLTTAQTLMDSADPINHASIIAEAVLAEAVPQPPKLHMLEVIDDQVVLNNVPNDVALAPLSGTDPLARLLGLTQIVDNSDTGGLVKFSAGDHGSIIDPRASLETTIEMQMQVATFARSQGKELPITNKDVIAPLP